MRCSGTILAALVSLSLSQAVADQPPPDEPTLPEVLVRPDFEPPGMATAEPGPALPSIYPSLAEQTISDAVFGERSIFDMPEMATVRTRERLDEMAPLTTPQALEEEVGVVIQRTNLGGGSPFIRGLTGNQVLILVDGIRLNNSTFRFGPNQYLNTIDPGQIERIEVIRGPQSVLYGSDAIGGVINVVTRGASGIGCAPGAGGSFVQRFSSSDAGLYSRLNVEVSGCQGGVFAGGSYLNLNDLDAGGPFGRQAYTGYAQSAADVKFDRLLGPNSMLTVGVQHFVQPHVPRTDQFVNFDEAYYFAPQQRDLYYVRLQGTELGGWIDAYRVTASFHRQQEGIDRQKFAATTLRHYFNDALTPGVSLLAATDLGSFGRLSYGVDWYRDEIHSTRVDINTQTQVVTPGRPTFPDNSTYNRFGLFVQDEVPLTERLKMVAGVRYENIDAASTPLVGISATPVHIAPSFQDWTGSVGLVYELGPCVHLVGSASEGFRAPGLDDLTALQATNQGIDLPSPDLAPETSWNYEVGLKADFERFRGQVFGFWTYLDDLIVRVPAGFQVEGRDAFVKINAGKGRIDGIELAGEYLLQGGWSLFGNYMYVYGRNVTDQEPISRIPPAQGIAGLRWRGADGRTWFEIYEWMVAKQTRLSARDLADPRIVADGQLLPRGYATLNLRAGRRVGDNGKVSLGLENILDRHYRVHGSGIDAPGITVTLGYEVAY